MVDLNPIFEVLCGTEQSTRLLKMYRPTAVIYVGHRSLVLEAIDLVSSNTVCIKCIPQRHPRPNEVPFELYIQSFLSTRCMTDGGYVLPVVNYFPGVPFCVIVSPLWGHPWIQPNQRTKEYHRLPTMYRIQDTFGSQIKDPEVALSIANAIEDLYTHLPIGAYRDLHSFLLAKGGGLNETQVKCIFQQIVDAVHQFRVLGLFHNDLKDENILVNDQLKIKIIDFGSSEFVGSETSIFRGTVEFASPEVRAGGRKAIDLESQEIWTLGCLLYGMLETCSKRDVDYVDLAGVMVKCLKNDPKQRMSFADIRECFA